MSVRSWVTTLLWCMLTLSYGQSHGQSSEKKIFPCGTTLDYVLQPPRRLPSTGMGLVGGVSSFSPSAIFTCGKIDVYYQDINLGYTTGFADTTSTLDPGYHTYLPGGTTLGEVRRNTLCGVLQYIQSVIDFSNVPSDHHIRLYVDYSYDRREHRAPIPTQFLARAAPSIDTTSPGVKKGWMADFITGATPGWVSHDSVSSDYFHGQIQVNFDKVIVSGPLGLDSTLIGYYEDYLLPVGYQFRSDQNMCGSIDAFSVLLHEITHAMGWVSLLGVSDAAYADGRAPYPRAGANVVSAMDWAFHVGPNSYPLSLTKVVSGTWDMPYVDSANPALHVNDNFWLGGQNAPDNYPVFSPGEYSQSLFSHLDNQPYTYTLRQRISPGDRTWNVMNPSFVNGEAVRAYTKAEIRGLVDNFGYQLTSSYVADSGFRYTNHLPYSKKMATYGIDRNNYAFFSEEVMPDTTITNDIGTSVTLHLPSYMGSDFIDADGDDITFDTSTVINFRGCGTGNNRGLLSYSPDRKSITFIPRPDFYGKVQLGCNLSDGHEDGGFVMFTIEVLKGSNCSSSPGGNLICNPKFELGTEQRSYTDLDNEVIPRNSVGYFNAQLEDKWQGISFSDAHPYNFYANLYAERQFSGNVVTWSEYECGEESHYMMVGVPLLSNTFGGHVLWTNPLRNDTLNQMRYQMFLYKGSSYYNLLDTLHQCHRYNLTFDFYNPDTFGTHPIPIKVGFLDHLVNPRTGNPDTALNFQVADTFTGGHAHWERMTVPFNYCGNPSTILYIRGLDSARFYLDNMSLTEDFTPPPPLSVSIAATGLPGCIAKLTATDSNSVCSPEFTWTTLAPGTITATDTPNVIDVPANVTATYHVNLSDGCRTASASYSIEELVPPPISGDSTVCVGSSISLYDGIAGGTWSSENPSVAMVDLSSGNVTGTGAGVTHISYTLFCAHTTVYTVTVNPIPSPITAVTLVCNGGTATMSDPDGGGKWFSGTPSVATVDSTGGLISGISAGTTIITYQFSSGCINTAVVTVPSVNVLACVVGPHQLCNGYSVTLTDTSGNAGTWTGSDATIGVGAATGFISGLSVGVGAVTYTISGGCNAIIPITVNATPTGIVAPDTLCAGSEGVAYGLPSGGEFEYFPTGTVIDSTILSFTPGGAVLTYTLPDGCSVTKDFYVNPLPASIMLAAGGFLHVCNYDSATFVGYPAGGTWSLSDPSVATVNAASGVVTGISEGTFELTYSIGSCYKTATIEVSPVPGPVTGDSVLCTYQSGYLYDATPGGSWSVYSATASSGLLSNVLTPTSAGTVTVQYTVPNGCHAYRTITANPTPGYLHSIGMGGILPVCEGSTTLVLSDVPGGVWSSDPSAVAGINSATGLLSGNSPGMATISYTTAAGCSRSTVATVNPAPAAISGPDSVCYEGTAMLYDSVSGGVWSSSSSYAVAVDSSTGVITGYTSAADISYTLPDGCSVDKTITVAWAGMIFGEPEICVGQTTDYDPLFPGGSWSSSDASVASVDASGVVTGISSGSATISYTAFGCTTTALITINSGPSISGDTTVCAGAALSLSSGDPGVWSSSDVSIADVDGTGTVTGIGAGTVTISLTNSSGCSGIRNVAVLAAPAPIVIPSTLCAGGTLTLADAVSGGTWSSSHPITAYVDASTGIVTGNMAGTVNITYTLSSGCYVVTPLPVTYPVLGITGSSTICLGSTSAYTDPVSGGTWSTADAGIASVSSVGVVSGVTTGTTILTYQTGSSCYAVKIISVVPNPSITGGVVCVGGNMSITGGSPGSWVSANTAVATVSSTGIVTGITSGTAIISYTNSIGCVGTAVATVNPNPLPVYGDNSLCAGSVGFLYDDMVGGTWSSSNPAQATVDITGMVWAAATPGAVTISYTLPTGCYATYAVTIHETPADIVIPATICSGASMTLSDATTGGTWSTSDASIATIGSSTGIVTGVSAGAVYVSYTSGFGCLTVTPLSINYPGDITGPDHVCVGNTITFSEVVSGGTWSSSSPSVATVNTSGVLTPVSAGVTTITYQVSTYCFATKSVTVNSLAPITGALLTCVGTTTTLSNPTTGGTWSSLNTPIATVGSASGVVTGVGPGVAAIVYTAPTGCQATAYVSVSPVPSPIGGPSSMCAGNPVTLTNYISGGTWSSSNVFVATIGSASGIASSALLTGTTTITYRITPTCYVTKTLTVNANPLPIGGSATICMPPSGSTTLTDFTPGGAWSSSNTAVANVITGTVTGVAPGTATISYTLPTGCYATKAVTVNASPGPITGTAAFCLGTTTTLSGSATGGVWTSATPSMASIGSSTGIVTGLIPGTVTISYTFPATGCMVFRQVTVTTTPALSPISGPDHLCLGNTITLTETSTGGGWVSSDPSLASITAGGVVTGMAYGTATISYVQVNACGMSAVTKTVTVNTLPEAIAGPNSMCIDTSLLVTLTDATPGGNWSSSTPAIVSISSTGVMTPVGIGSATITYSTGAGCMATATVYVGRDDGDCTPCHELHKRPYTTLGSSIISSLGTGYYYVPVTTYINAHVSWNNAVMFMAPDIDVYVSSDKSLTIAGSHLFSCNKQMWDGIRLNSDGATQTARIILKEGLGAIPTLIEDARVAVSIKSPQQPNSGAPYYIASYNTIFNRNNVGIYIGDYIRTTAATPGADPYAYEFHIENTVFTCRDLTIASYPFAWPGTTGSGGLKTSISASAYKSPYNIINYPLARCHNLLLNTIGIQAQGVGAGADANFAGLVAGEPSTATVFSGTNTQLDLYDGLAYGIYAINANITARNSVFANMRSNIDKAPKPVPDNGLTGIYTAMNNAQKYRLRVEAGTYTYYVLGRPTTVESPNAFYDCGYGVYSKDYYTIKGYKATMTTGQNDPNDKSRYGYYLQSSAYNDVQITQNSIYNVANGVVFLSTLGAGYWVYPTTGSPYYVAPYQLAGNINVSNNSINAAVGSTVPTTQFCHAAIWLQNMVNSPKKGASAPVFAPGTVYTDNNTIKDAYHGIYIQSYWAQRALTRYNTITLASSPVDPTSWGVNHTDCAKNMIYSNRVTGSTFAAAKPMIDSTRAYYLNYNSNQELYCNYATNTGRGFEFYLNNPGTYWHHNHMTGNFKGYVLNNAIIGPQGGDHNPIENEWHNPSWWNPTTNLQTYVVGQNAYDSRIYVQNTITKMPTVNFASPSPYLYSLSLSSIVTTNAMPSSTSPCAVWRPAGLGSDPRLTMHEIIAKKDVPYAVDSAINDWLVQFTTWQTIKDDSSMLDSSEVLNSFNSLAGNSRYAAITALEEALANSDSTGVDSILTASTPPITDVTTYTDSSTGVIVADDHNSDYIVDNYKAVFRLYHKYHHGLLTADDSTQICGLAALCPARYGNAVYRARTLYTLVNADLHIWNDDSCGIGDTAIIASRHSSSGTKASDGVIVGQHYSLFPNPNNGELTIRQLALDDKPVQVTVFTITGVKVYEGLHSLTNGQSTLKLGNVASGMYMMKITDSENRIFTIKFIVQ